MRARPISQSPAFVRSWQARRVQIISGLEHCDQIERAGAVKIITLGNRPADASSPAISVLENEQRHSGRPGTVKRPRLFDNHLLKLVCRLEKSRTRHRPRTSCCGEPLHPSSRLNPCRGKCLRDRTGRSADQMLHLRRPIGSGMPLPVWKAEGTVERPLVTRSNRPDETEAMHPPAWSAGMSVPLGHRKMPWRRTVMKSTLRLPSRNSHL